MDYKIIHPHKVLGAIMRVLIPGQPELAFQDGYETTTSGNDYLPISVGIAYPCPKHFRFTFGALGGLECIYEDHEHGRAIVSCDDGTALMPHILRTKADIVHLIEDLIGSDHFACYFGDDTRWEETLRHILMNDPISLSLPEGDRSYQGEYNMHGIVYWM
jgi:hypothetical protein